MTIKPIPSELSQTEFLNLFGSVFEKSNWIAEDLYLSGIKNEYNNADGLHMQWSEYSGHQVMIKSSVFF